MRRVCLLRRLVVGSWKKEAVDEAEKDDEDEDDEGGKLQTELEEEENVRWRTPGMAMPPGWMWL